MNMQNSEKSGIITFSGVKSSKLDLNGSGPLKESVVVYRCEVANNSGSAAECGVGYELNKGQVIVGQVDLGTNAFVERDLSVDGAFTDTILILSPVKLNSIGVTVSVADQKGDLSYWNGSSFVAFSSTQIDTDATGEKYVLSINQPQAVKKDAIATIPGGFYAYVIENAGNVTITDINCVDLLTYNDCGSNATLVDGWDNGKKLPYGSKLVAFTTVANAANWMSFEYAKSV